MQLAVVNYAADDAPARFARSMHETGFGILVEHPISDGLVDAICDEWLGFFSTRAKHDYLRADGEQAGYFPAPDDRAAVDGTLIRDRKEFFHVRPRRRYPGEVSDAALRYFDEAIALSATLLAWLAANTPADVAARFSMPLPRTIDGAAGTVLRVQHYIPQTTQQPAGAVRALAHTDINLITLLPAPSRPGLQIRDTAGGWHDVPCDSRALIVNAGEMLELVTRGHYPATQHRVVHPTDTQPKGSRLSLPLFVHPAADVRLSPEWTAAGYLKERVEAMRREGWLVTPGGEETAR